MLSHPSLSFATRIPQPSEVTFTWTDCSEFISKSAEEVGRILARIESKHLLTACIAHLTFSSRN
jgi:hypothetical protein